MLMIIWKNAMMNGQTYYIYNIHTSCFLFLSDPKERKLGLDSGGRWIERPLLRDALWQDERQEADQVQSGELRGGWRIG